MSALPEPGTVNPADGSPLEPVAHTAASEVPGLVQAARAVQADWARKPLSERSKHVLELGRKVVEGRSEVLPILAAETGRTDADNLFAELVTFVAYTKGAVSVAKKALAPEKVKLSPIEFPGKKAVVEQVPRGVVGIIEPWNYPLLQFYKALLPALLSGNTVVMKPSEHTPRSGLWLYEKVRACFPEGVVQVAVGGGDVGAALVEHADAIVFTGSVPTGKKVAARCAELLKPCSVELGGKDAAIVLADADIDRTAKGIAFGAFHNAGQDCASIERIYVEESIADAFLQRFAAIADQLRVPEDVGPLQNAAQLAIVERHVASAKEQGATVVAGGEKVGTGYGYRPTILDGCRNGMTVVDDETFGPVVAVIRVPTGEEAVSQANDSRYGLTSSVWTGNLQRGEQLARQLEVGVALVNNHSFAGVIPQIPWTGTKETGTGVAASRHSYHVFVRPRTLVIDKNKDPEPFWFPADEALVEMGHTLAEFSLGAFARVFSLLGLLGKRKKTVSGS